MALHEGNKTGDVVGNILQRMVNNDIETVFKDSNSSRTTRATATKQKPKQVSTAKAVSAKPQHARPNDNVNDTAGSNASITGAKMADDGPTKPTPDFVQNEPSVKQKGAREVDKPGFSGNKFANNGDNVEQLNSNVINTASTCINKTKSISSRPQTKAKPKTKPDSSEGAKVSDTPNVEGDIKGKSSNKHKGKSSTPKSDTAELKNLRSDIASIKGMLKDLVPTVCVLKNAYDQAQECEEVSSEEEDFQANSPSVPDDSPAVLYVRESEEGELADDTTSDGKCVILHCGFAPFSALYTHSSGQSSQTVNLQGFDLDIHG